MLKSDSLLPSMSPVGDSVWKQSHLNINRRFTCTSVNESVFNGPTSDEAEQSADI